MPRPRLEDRPMMVHLRLRQSEVRVLDAAAARGRLSRSDALRQAIRQWLAWRATVDEEMATRPE